MVQEQITIYTDGSCINNGKQNAACGGGIWVSDNNPLNKTISIPGNKHSNQIGELTAVLVALQSINPLTPLKIITDSKYTINRLTTHLQDWEDIGWIGIENMTLFQAAAYHLRRRPAPTTFQWTKGHDGHIGNEQADKLALTGAQRVDTDVINTYVPRNFDIQGAKLTKMTQKLAYKAIMCKTHLEYKRATLSLLDVSRFAIQSISSSLETDAAIWWSCRSKDISKNIQAFIYKTLNAAYRIGEFWTQVPTFEHRAMCQLCPGETESMEHILTQCSCPTRTTIWELARQLWPQHHRPWPTPHIGLILGCGLLSIPTVQPEDNTPHKRKAALKKGASRLLRILISESAHLIWTLRCERVIREVTHIEDNVKKRWLSVIDRRLQLDREIACKTRRDHKTTIRVKNTWSEVIHDPLHNQPPPDNWVTHPEVLVGIKLPRPSQSVAPR
jgi:ribonuclease HI